MSKIVEDPRIDPRIKAVMGAMPIPVQEDVTDRDAMLRAVNMPDALAAQERLDGRAAVTSGDPPSRHSGLHLPQRVEILRFVGLLDNRPCLLFDLLPYLWHGFLLWLIGRGAGNRQHYDCNPPG